MEKQYMDARTEEDIIGQIREKALSYVPEWKFDDKYPDMGTVLALVYRNMLYKTLNKFNQILSKNRISFLNELDARLLPAVPAEGCVAFSLVNDEVEGSLVPAGTPLSALSEATEDGFVHYRTVDDVYVSPSVLSAIYHTCDRTDFISELPVEFKDEDVVLFSDKYSNLQKHELYIAHNEALAMKGEGWIELIFYLRGDLKVEEETLKLLADRDRVSFGYSALGAYQEFSARKVEGGSLWLFKSEDQLAMEKTVVDGTESYFIRCSPRQIEGFKEFHFDRLLLRTEGGTAIPDSVMSDGIECCVKQFAPFGERLTEFSEVYFASSETLSKKGAWIELSFYLKFTRIQLEYGEKEEAVQWDWVMKQSDFKSDPEYDITIDTVVWEYYNGTGWARLYPDDSNSHIFYPAQGVQGGYKKLSFLCPLNMTAVTVNSLEACCIRARITRIHNRYKMKGAYVVPILENTAFRYCYPGPGLRPDHLITGNNLEFCHNEGYPFVQMGDKNFAMYLGFQNALTQGPIRLLFLIKKNSATRGVGLLWEYWDGGRWKEVNLTDETRGFSRTGIVTLMGNGDIQKKRLMGSELYWLRVTDTDGYYARPESRLPILQGIYMNATKIINVDKEETQYFKMELYQENMRFNLMDKKIMEAVVYVDEIEHLSRSEMDELNRQGLLDIVYDDGGLAREIWVKWECTEDFTKVQPGSRACLLNRNEGYLTFGNGRQGRIPPISRKDNIRVRYLVGGGAHTNALAGTVKQLGHEIGYINRVYNPLALSGGCNQELLDTALIRSCAQIRHQNRAITARDYEELTLAASRKIRRAVCFPGRDRYGVKTSGALTLVIMMEGDWYEESGFETVREEVQQYLKGKISGDLHSDSIVIREPDWIELGVRAKIAVKSFNHVFQVKKQVTEKLEHFLNPFSGNFHGRGWDVGSLPEPIQIKNALSDSVITGIDYIQSICIIAHIRDSSGLKEIDIGSLKDKIYTLPVSGRHELSVSVSQ